MQPERARTPPLGDEPPDSGWTQQVSSAFRNYHSTLALSHSPLATSALVAPALVRDPLSPTADERGHALRLVLQWAVSLLAPEPPAYPLGADRPYDDPTWRDPRWWRYNLLRHRYLEPLHPDEFVEGGRYTETLVALTGIPSADTFFEERNRAIREVAVWLQQAANSPENETLQQLALADALRPLRQQPAARALLDIAATFDGVFARALLLAMAADERVTGAESALAHVITLRLLRSADRAAELWLSPLLRAYLYGRQPEGQLQRRHLQAARYYETAGGPLDAARHWQRAGQPAAAARILFSAAADLVHELQIGDLCEALRAFRPGDLSPEQWRAAQILLCDLALGLGQRDEALAACRRALKAAQTPDQQARIFRRMGKLYEQFNQLHALGYYDQAAAGFAPDDPEFVTLLKDRAWLHVLRREWPAAEADLARALELAPEPAHELRADLFDVMAILQRDQRRPDEAVTWARKALALRESLGHLPRIADSYNNLGLLYNALGDYAGAIAAFDEALAIYRTVGNQERVGAALLNIGMAHHLAGRRRQAIDAYFASLPLLEATGRRLIQARAHYNLAEAYAEIAEVGPARRHWQTSYALCLAAGFDDELRDLAELRERFPALGATLAASAADPQPAQAPSAAAPDSAQHPALAIARRAGQVTVKALIAATGVSKATATRQLAELVRQGLLHAQGKARATTYSLRASEQADALGPIAISAGDDQAMILTLRAQTDWLATRYGVTALDLGRAAQAAPALPVRIRFATEPSLADFFTLERWLGERLGQRIDLQPMDAEPV